jgi:hypothetical protein
MIPVNILYTYNNEVFLKFENIYEEVKIMYTYRFLDYMLNSEVLIADGTFMAAPADYSQLYVMYAFYRNKCIPVIYILMNTKKEEEYIKIFKIISKFGKFTKLKAIIIDQERAVFNALKFHLLIFQYFSV